MHLCLFQQLNGLEEDVDLDNAELDSLHEDLESRKEVGLGDIAKDLNKNQEAEHDHPHPTRHTHGNDRCMAIRRGVVPPRVAEETERSFQVLRGYVKPYPQERGADDK